MKKKIWIFALSLFVLILSGCFPCRTFDKANPPADGIAFLKNLGGGIMSNSVIILKINNNYNTFCYGMKLPWAYNESTNCGFNLEIPAGKTTLEVVYKGNPPVKLEFTAQKNKTYIIENEGENASCIKVFEKESQDKKEVSICGQDISYKEPVSTDNKKFATIKIDNKFRDCIHNEVLKIDSLWGDKKTGLGWGYYTYQLNTEYKIAPGSHSIELLSGDDRIPRTINFEAKPGKAYIIDIINEIKGALICTGKIAIIEISE
jgi:hypothetical protein